MRSEPSDTPLLAIVGEAPGSTEFARGRPFVGASGILLRELLEPLGLKRDDIYWANAINCDCPPLRLDDARPLCAPRLAAEIAALPPSTLLVPLGSQALSSVLGGKKRSILAWRGSVSTLSGGRLMVPSVHPAFALRAQPWRDVLARDLGRAVRLARAGSFIPPEKLEGRRFYTCDYFNLEEIDALGDTIAFDVETTIAPPTENKLLCLALSDGRTTLVVPWTRDRKGAESYWGAVESRVAALISRCFASRTVVTQNGPAFDWIVARRYGIKQPVRWEDTLLAYHVAHGELPKNLAHIVHYYLDVPPWKQESDKGSVEGLWHYNGLDALYTILAWREVVKEII